MHEDDLPPFPQAWPFLFSIKLIYTGTSCRPTRRQCFLSLQTPRCRIIRSALPSGAGLEPLLPTLRKDDLPPYPQVRSVCLPP